VDLDDLPLAAPLEPDIGSGAGRLDLALAGITGDDVGEAAATAASPVGLTWMRMPESLKLTAAPPPLLMKAVQSAL
jgi:hypothetical protein